MASAPCLDDRVQFVQRPVQFDPERLQQAMQMVAAQIPRMGDLQQHQEQLQGAVQATQLVWERDLRPVMTLASSSRLASKPLAFRTALSRPRSRLKRECRSSRRDKALSCMDESSEG